MPDVQTDVCASAIPALGQLRIVRAATEAAKKAFNSGAAANAFSLSLPTRPSRLCRQTTAAYVKFKRSETFAFACSAPGKCMASIMVQMNNVSAAQLKKPPLR